MDVANFCITENCTMLEAMALLDELARKVLFVVRDYKLVGSLTDGDIRRWILKKGDISATVKSIANYKPKFIYEYNRASARRFLQENAIEALPIIDENHYVKAIIFKDAFEALMVRKLQAPVVIMAGGLGTRLHPYTKILPKPLIPIGDYPIIERIIDRFYDQGCNEFHLIVNHKKNMIKAYFNELERDYSVNYADEEVPLGTGGGLALLKGQIQKTFILSNCDILVLEDFEKIYKYHCEQGNLITMICSLKNFRIPYGVVSIDQNGQIEKMEEKPELSFFTNTGVYVVEPRVIEEMESGKAIHFTDIISKYKGKGEKIGFYPISENSWLDMGELESMDDMLVRLGLQQ